MIKHKLTLYRSVVAIACIGMGFGLLRALLPYDYIFGFGTVYSVGYSESRFDSIGHGMSTDEVGRIMGDPLKEMPKRWYGIGDVWAYSDQPNPIANYRRRWIIFRNGKVSEKLKDFWVD